MNIINLHLIIQVTLRGPRLSISHTPLVRFSGHFSHLRPSHTVFSAYHTLFYNLLSCLLNKRCLMINEYHGSFDPPQYQYAFI
jgi:hypothetical protein